MCDNAWAHMFQVANSNALLAQSLGIGPIGGGDGGNDDRDEAIGAPFQIEVEPNHDQIDDVRIYSNPLVRAVFVKKSDYDEESKDALIVLIPGFGFGSTIDKPHKISETEFIVCVHRTNQLNLVRQLNPAVEDGKVTNYSEKIDAAITKSFGKHFDYKLLNNAFHAMSPSDESWNVWISVNEPFALGNFNDVVCLHTKDAVDMVLCVPLRTQTPTVEEIPVSLNIFGEDQ